MSRPRVPERTPMRLEWADRLIEAGALFLLVFTPLAYGTVELWSEAVAEVVVLAMVVVWLFRTVLRKSESRIDLPAGWVPATLFLALVVLQAIPLPRGLITLVSPWTASLHDTAAAYIAGVGTGPVPISLAPHTTWREGLKLGALAAFFLVCHNTYRTPAQGRRALWTMIIVGTLISIFGIAQRMTWTGRFYWIGPEAPNSSAFGPFVNRAHFAGLMVVVVPTALALMLAGRRELRRRPNLQGWKDRLRQWSSTEAGPTRLIPFLILLMGGAALVSGSRGGVVALMAALLAMIGLDARGQAGRRRAAYVAIVTALIILAGIWIGGDILYSTIERLAQEVGGREESARVHIWTDALRLWVQFPALGTGLGTFGVAFPRVRTLEAPVVFTHAESDWIQLFTDTGAVGLFLALAAVGTVGFALLQRYRTAESRCTRALALAGLVALIGSAVQGIGNYNLPVMANFLYLAMLLTLALGDLPAQGERP